MNCCSGLQDLQDHLGTRWSSSGKPYKLLNFLVPSSSFYSNPVLSRNSKCDNILAFVNEKLISPSSNLSGFVSLVFWPLQLEMSKLCYEMAKDYWQINLRYVKKICSIGYTSQSYQTFSCFSSRFIFTAKVDCFVTLQKCIYLEMVKFNFKKCINWRKKFGRIGSVLGVSSTGLCLPCWRWCQNWWNI